MTTLADALDHIRSGALPSDLESDRLEFKQEESADPRRSLQMLADAVVCLANAQGGTIVVGVADTVGGSRAFRGVSTKLTMDVIRKGIFDRTRPSLSVPVAEMLEGPARLVVITVPQGAVFYANAAGTATRRVGTECRPFPPEEQRQAMAARGLTDWSAEATDLGMEAVAADEVARVRRLLLLAGREDLARSDERKLARDLRLLNARGKLTRAGLLILGDAEALAAIIPNHGFAYQYRASPGSESSARVRSNRAILGAIASLLDAVGVRSRVHPLSASSGVQLQIQDYPKDAIRELVVNALVHRDYELGGTVEVEHSPDSLAVTSPGGLVFGITPDNILTHPSTPRNRLLLETVTALQVAERTGQGIDRAYRELLRTGKEPPMIADDGYQVRVLVPGGTGNDAFARSVAELDPGLAGDVDVLLALSQLRDARNIDAVRLAATAQRSTSEAQGVLERMTHAKLLEPTVRTASRALPTYVLTGLTLASLGRAVRYHVRRADETDRKVADHIREYGHVTNQTLRRLFDLDVAGARDLLRALQVRGLLVKLDQGRGGPGIRYGPGPKMQLGEARPSRIDRSPASGDLRLGRCARGTTGLGRHPAGVRRGRHARA
ncbi:MAG: ATP-binding protein [Chloroflexota bacterium]